MSYAQKYRAELSNNQQVNWLRNVSSNAYAHVALMVGGFRTSGMPGTGRLLIWESLKMLFVINSSFMASCRVQDRSKSRFSEETEILFEYWLACPVCGYCCSRCTVCVCVCVWERETGKAIHINILTWFHCRSWLALPALTLPAFI